MCVMLMPTLNNQLNANVGMKKKLSKYANNFYKMLQRTRIGWFTLVIFFLGTKKYYHTIFGSIKWQCIITVHIRHQAMKAENFPETQK